MSIAGNIEDLKRHVPESVAIVAVSKFQPVESLLEAYRAGQRVFGENRVQELVNKQPLMPADTTWHFIGHLQSNKVRQIVPFIDLIHSIDSLNLLKEINREAGKANRVIDCLLQFHIATEETKFGLSFTEAGDLLKSAEYNEMHHVRIVGVMGMASFSDDHDLVRGEFRMLKRLFSILKADFFGKTSSFQILSMGMSGDYSIAIEEGSNMIRIGTSIFGSR